MSNWIDPLPVFIGNVEGATSKVEGSETDSIKDASCDLKEAAIVRLQSATPTEP